jgi:hypothetical protein
MSWLLAACLTRGDCDDPACCPLLDIISPDITLMGSDPRRLELDFAYILLKYRAPLKIHLTTLGNDFECYHGRKHALS